MSNDLEENKQLKIEQREDIPLFLLNFFKKQTKISKVEFDLLYCFEFLAKSAEEIFFKSRVLGFLLDYNFKIFKS